jgi:hypothetical protein
MRRIPSPSTTLPSWGMLLQAARWALRPRPDGALSGGVDLRDASDHGASADTRTPCMALSRRQRLVSVILVAPARLNSRKNKDKSERLVTSFVRVPGMCEARPRYHRSRQPERLGRLASGWNPAPERQEGGAPRTEMRGHRSRHSEISANLLYPLRSNRRDFSECDIDG